MQKASQIFVGLRKMIGQCTCYIQFRLDRSWVSLSLQRAVVTNIQVRIKHMTRDINWQNNKERRKQELGKNSPRKRKNKLAREGLRPVRKNQCIKKACQFLADKVTLAGFKKRRTQRKFKSWCFIFRRKWPRPPSAGSHWCNFWTHIVAINDRQGFSTTWKGSGTQSIDGSRKTILRKIWTC